MREEHSISVWSLSLGCPKNRVDTEKLLGSVRGLKSVDRLCDADLVVINTCAFIESAVRESVRRILECVEEVKSCKKRPYLCVAGCLVGRYGRETLQGDLPEVDLWLETKDIAHWGEMLCHALRIREQSSRILSTPPSYAWLKIGEGCRHHCSFCTIPSIRGDLHSRKKEDIVAEARMLLDKNVREIILVAQDVTAWGTERGENLCSLLESLLPLEGLRWLRLLYLYPAGLQEDVLSFLAHCPKPFLPYLDIPLQHSHPDILKSMGRPFAKNPRMLLERVRHHLPDAVLRTTFIVGYPGESEAHFRDLCRFVEENEFLHMGVFAYEREEGTVAHDLSGQVSKRIAQERRRELMEIQHEISAHLLENYVGTEEEILIDSPNPEWPGLFNGRTWFQAPEIDGQTYVSGEGCFPNAFVKAEIVESSAYDLTALA